MADPHLDLSLGDSPATEALGAALARSFLHLDGGLGSAVAYLRGELGSGKTTCARSLLRTLGVVGLIRSPTYTLVEVYQPAGITCIHVDLYRVQGPVEVDELGLRDLLDARHLLLVEWPEKGGSALPPPDLELSLSYADHARQARLDAPTACGAEWVNLLQHDNSLRPYVSNIT